MRYQQFEVIKAMSYMPLSIDMKGKKALVVGGGKVALRKILPLLDAGARLKVVAILASDEINLMNERREIELCLREYRKSDLKDVFLAVAATDSEEANHRIALDARSENIIVLVADHHEYGDCIFPARLRRGNLDISVSSGGTAPGFSVIVRDRIAEIIGEEYASLLEQAAEKREKLLTASERSK